MPTDEETLRAAAAHRGLKLVKSRKRKPGVGDFGFFGLADAAGKPLFGIEDAGLTATAEQIAEYLKKGEASTWAESARVTPDAVGERKPRAKRRPADDQIKAPVKARSRSSSTSNPETPRPRLDATARTKEAIAAAAPSLQIRNARAGDAEGVAALLPSTNPGSDASAVRTSIAAAAARKEPILIAHEGEVVGCLAWHIVPLLQGSTIGRITALIVRERDRRRGIGRALFDAASSDFAKRKVTEVETISEIAVRNANGFYRAVGLEQIGYRFGRKL